MKALTALQFVYLEWEQQVEYIEYLNLVEKGKKYYYFDEIFCPYADFISQPFTPEMITEKFKGWTKRHMEGSGIDMYELGKNSDIAFYRSHNNKGLCGYRYLPNISILDDFIRDCQRAGIELEFKEKDNQCKPD